MPVVQAVRGEGFRAAGQGVGRPAGRGDVDLRGSERGEVVDLQLVIDTVGGGFPGEGGGGVIGQGGIGRRGEQRSGRQGSLGVHGEGGRPVAPVTGGVAGLDMPVVDGAEGEAGRREGVESQRRAWEGGRAVRGGDEG